MPSSELSAWAPIDMPPGWGVRVAPAQVVRDWWRSGDPRVYEESIFVECVFYHVDGAMVDLELRAPPDPRWLRAFLIACEGIAPGVQVTDVYRYS